MHKTTIFIQQHNSAPSSPMATSALQVMRTSIFTLLKGLPFFTSTPSLLALPFALSTLLVASPASSSHLFSFVHEHVASLFVGVGIPQSSEPFAVLAAKLSQTILSSVLISPFSLSFLLLAKASVIRALQCHRGEIFSWIVPFKPLLITHLCSLLLVLASNAACFSLLVVLLNCSKVLGLPSHGTLVVIGSMLAVLYSIVLANAYVVCNMSLILSGIERHGGFCSILKVWVLIQGRTAAALSLSLPINAALAATEALFQYRIMKPYHRSMAANPCILFEVLLVAYLYAVLIVLETIIGTVFLNSCIQDLRISHSDMHSYHVEIHGRGDVHSYHIVINKTDDAQFERVKALPLPLSRC